MLNFSHNLKLAVKSLRLGDWLIVAGSLIAIVYLFQTLWSSEHATKVQIRLGDKIYATYTLNQQRDVHVHGPIGNAVISIAHGKARFSKSPCHNQYCVHQGWLTRAGQAAICLPNQISLELIGESKPYDSLNY
ncbi:MAG: NusG domain II-containing protein [Methylotenera sp.]|nr:NusG domain II-containing protein [Methylotenera sp.]MDP1959624.1 NusG domain II-containing protein [Methylotenera sp.]MDP3207477.1 NusG domain II-containing protein [Methylotenera sp.]MDP3943220.1 NusG domain II-containing protein [Methylotenera sp.]